MLLTSPSTRLAFILIALSLAGCGACGPAAAPQPDAGIDAGRDAGRVDGGSDAGRDAGSDAAPALVLVSDIEWEPVPGAPEGCIATGFRRAVHPEQVHVSRWRPCEDVDGGCAEMFPDSRWRYWEFRNGSDDSGVIDGHKILRLSVSTVGSGHGDGTIDTFVTLDGGAVIATKHGEDYSRCFQANLAAGDGAIALDYIHSIREHVGEAGEQHRVWWFRSIASASGPGDARTDFTIPASFGPSNTIGAAVASQEDLSAFVFGMYYARMWPDGRFQRIDTSVRGALAQLIVPVGGEWFARERGDSWYIVSPPAAGETRARVFLREEGADPGDIRAFQGDRSQFAWWSAYPGGAVASEYRRHAFSVAPFTTNTAELRPRRVATMESSEAMPMLYETYFANNTFLTGWGDGETGGQAILIDAATGRGMAFEVPPPWTLAQMIDADARTVTISVRRVGLWEMRIWRLDRSLFTPYDRVIPAVP